MGCCESQHDPSQFQKPSHNNSSIGQSFVRRPFVASFSLDDGTESSGPLGAVQRAADAIREATFKEPEPNALRNVRLALLSLPRDSSNVPDVPERDIKEIIEILRLKSEASDLVLTGLVLMRYLAQRVENQKKIASARGVSLVLHALQAHDSNPTLQDETNTQQFLELRGVDSVFQVVKMSMANTRVMEAACFLLGNVASSQEGLQHIARNKGGAVALKVMEAHESDAELLRELLFLLSNLAQSVSIQAELKKAGAVKAVVGVMAMHEEAVDLQDVTAYECERVVASLVKVLKRHKTNGSVVKRACSGVATLGCLSPTPACLHNNPEVLDALLDAAPAAFKPSDRVSHLCALLSMFRTCLAVCLGGRKGQEGQGLVQLLRALEALAAHRANAEGMVGIAGTGRVMSLVKDIVSSPSAKPPAVARALALLSALTETCQGQAGSGVEVPAGLGLQMVALALDRHWNQASVVMPGCTLVASLARGPDSGPQGPTSRPPSRDAPGGWDTAMASLVRALRARPGDVGVAVSACVALAWTVEKQARPGPGLVSDIMSALVMVLRAHQGDADVAEAACFLLSAIAKDASKEDKEHIMRSGLPLLVVMLLRHFADQAGDVEPVLRRAVNALRLVLALADSATAGAVTLAGAPAALRKIQSRYGEAHALHRAAGNALAALAAD